MQIIMEDIIEPKQGNKGSFCHEQPWWAPFHRPPSREAPRQLTIYVTRFPYDTLLNCDLITRTFNTRPTLTI